MECRGTSGWFRRERAALPLALRIQDATANRKITLLANGKVLWTYRQSKTRQFQSIELDPLDFISRFLQHILPRHFARVRFFGWLHPAAKVRANRVRALLRRQPLLSPAEKKTWNVSETAKNPPPEIPRPETAANPCTPSCDRCRKPMQLYGLWRAGQTLFHARPSP